MLPDIDAFELFSEDLKSQDCQIRVETIRRLPIVAEAIGPDRTRSELLPFLHETYDYSDEVLSELALALDAKFVPLVGGIDYANEVLLLLGRLAHTEESVVRGNACKSLIGIIESLPMEMVESDIMVLLNTLITNDSFASHISACHLFPTVYARFSGRPKLGEPSVFTPEQMKQHAEHRATLRKLFEGLPREEPIMVRRAASATLHGLARAMPKDEVRSDLIHLWAAGTKDDHDVVRRLALDASVPVAQALEDPEEIIELVFPAVEASVRDKSWSVRRTIATNLHTFFSLLGESFGVSKILPLYQRLLCDPESSVRADAVATIAKVVEVVKVDPFVPHLSRLLTACTQDFSKVVRLAATSAYADLMPHLLSSTAATDTVLDLIVDSLNDELPEVRLNTLGCIPALIKTLDKQVVVDKIQGHFVALHSDPFWRVRAEVTSQLPHFAKLHDEDQFNATFLPLVHASVKDRVYMVRSMASRAAFEVACHYGLLWTRDSLISILKFCFTNSHATYLERISVLHVIKELLGASALSDLAKEVYELVQLGFKDPVPNVRYAALRSVENTIARSCPQPFFPESMVKEEILPAIKELSQDSDSNVSETAQQVLEAAAEL